MTDALDPSALVGPVLPVLSFMPDATDENSRKAQDREVDIGVLKVEIGPMTFRTAPRRERVKFLPNFRCYHPINA